MGWCGILVFPPGGKGRQAGVKVGEVGGTIKTKEIGMRTERCRGGKKDERRKSVVKRVLKKR